MERRKFLRTLGTVSDFGFDAACEDRVKEYTMSILLNKQAYNYPSSKK